MQDLLNIIGRDAPLFTEDLAAHGAAIDDAIAHSRFLIIGGGGSIGGAVVREIFQRNPSTLHVVDVNENNLAELVRDVRSTWGYIDGDFRTLCLDCNGVEFEALIADNRSYDYVLNFAALKHVRSEKDPYTLMRMIDVNIFGTLRTIKAALTLGADRYFCVSTDKATNPVNMMGASKRIMEMFLMRESQRITVSTARFANVAFSDGSLPYSWLQRIRKNQPLVAPNDVRRYFVTEQEGALLCLFSAILGDNRDVFFPKLSEKLHLVTFAQVATRYLQSIGREPLICESEDEARAIAAEGVPPKKWPCFFFASDTTGEKDFEEFYTDIESVDWDRFRDIGIVKTDLSWEPASLDRFEDRIRALRAGVSWTRAELVELFTQTLGSFDHLETGRFLDDKM